MSPKPTLEALQWLQQYRKLSAKQSEGLTDLETQKLKELEMKIAQFIEPKTEAGPPHREHLRAPTRFEVAIKTAGEMKKFFIKNISGGGMFIETPQIQPTGTKLDLHLVIPDHPKVIHTVVEVCWTQTRPVGDLQEGMGVRFLKLETDAKKAIQKLVEAQIEKVIESKS
jgi:uncharacterized protein (TIGR02266 family)